MGSCLRIVAFASTCAVVRKDTGAAVATGSPRACLAAVRLIEGSASQEHADAANELERLSSWTAR